MSTEYVEADPTITPEQIEQGQQAYRLDREHVFHSWAAQAQLDPMTVIKAEGSYVWDGQGHKLLDFSSQMVNTNIGHSHPAVVAAIQQQAARIATIAPAHVNDARSEAARLISDLVPDHLNHVFFTNAGAEAVEHATRMARLHTGRPKILSAYRSYHGGTERAINITGDTRRFPVDTASQSVVHFMPAYFYRSLFGSTTLEEETQRALDHLEQTIIFEGPDTIACIILETVPGTAGIYVPPPGYMAGVQHLARRYGIMFITDEVMVGFGRTGAWFGFQHWGLTPDLVTFAKGVNSGYVPLGGVIISDEIYTSFADRAYPGGLTYSGHPLACAAAVACIRAMDEEGMVTNADRLGREILGPGVVELAEKHPSVGDARGLGAFWALELVTNRETKEPLAPYGGSSPAMNAVVAECKKLGLLPFSNANRIHLAPPLNISDADARRGLEILDSALDVADSYYEGG